MATRLITIQQAYAVSYGVLHRILPSANTTFTFTFSCTPAVTINNLASLLSGSNVELGLIADNTSANNVDPDNDTYIATGLPSDYFLTGGDLFGNGTISDPEKNYHLTGYFLMNKIKK